MATGTFLSMSMAHVAWRAALGLLGTFYCVAGFAQPKITSIAPDWIHRGASLDVTIAGEGLGSVTGFVFSGASGLSASVILESNPPPVVTVESSARSITAAESGPRDRNKSLRARLTAADNAALGVRELRALAPNGISSVLNVTVGAVPEVAEVEPNNALDQAQSVTFPVAVAGAIGSGTEMDHFRFKAKKGEQIVLEVMAQRSGSPLDSSLAIFDASGREMARNEDARGFDSLMEFTAPADGEFIAQLRDFQYRGGGDYKYRLFIGTLPFVDSIFPFGGQRGKTVEISIKGRNVQAEKMTLNIDGKSPLGRQEIRLNMPSGLSNPIQFDVEELPEIVEAEPNNSGTNIAAVSLPIIVNGKISPAKDVDGFKFKVGSDQKLVCSVQARRFGSSLDAFVGVHAGDNVVAQNDDADGSDARLEFDAKKDVEYSIIVRDLTERGGENFGYRLSLRSPSAATPSLAAKYFPDAIRLHRDGRTRIRCEISRQAFDGPVRLSAAALPPGVSADPLVIPAGRNEGDLLITASPEAVLGTAPIRIVATAQAAGGEMVRDATPIEPANNAERVFQRGFLTVLERAPFTIDVVTLASTLDQMQSGSLEAVVNRRPGFSQEVKLSAVGFSAGREPITKSLDVKEITVKGNETTVKVPLTAKVDSEVATRAVFIRGEATEAGEKVVQFSQPVAVSVTQVPFVLSAAPAKLSLNTPRSGSTNFDEVILKVKVDRRNFAGEIPLVIDGTLPGVKIEGTNLSANAAEAAVKFIATESTPPLTNVSFSVSGAAMHNDRLYRHKTGAIRLSVLPPAATVELASTNAAVIPKP